VRDALAARTLELVDFASESREEAALAAHVLELIPGARDAGDTCVLAGVTERGDRPLVLLAGHLDTVPAQGNRPGSRDADAVHGLGACDMKSGVAVMIEMALADAAARTVDLGFVFFGREEIQQSESALTPLLEREAGLRTADLAIVMEPTDNTLQAGCLGNLNATWTFHGTAGHSARPWLADNAIHRAGQAIAALTDIGTEEHTYGGLTFTEAISVTRLSGGIADNVIPDVATAHVNYRYAPGRTPHDAEARLREWCEPWGSLVVVSDAPSGRVPEGNELVQRLRAAGDLALEPKQAWTPVAEFAMAGVDAINFGPGDPRWAHRPDEQVAIDALVRSYEVLERFACA
jgi:succinyl-diaminopimelate desuccinylase